MTVNDPVAMRRQLRVELKRLRTHAQLTQRQVAEALDWSPSKIIRIENGSVAIGVTDLRALLAHYGLDDQQAMDELVSMARGSKKQPFIEYRDILSPETIRFFGYEASASIIRQVEPLVIPGLLQTEEYTRALLTVHGISPNQADRFIESRRERQELLDRPNPPELFFILDEATLRRAIGGKSVMRRQLERLMELGGQSSVTIQILPFSSGAHAGVRGPFVYLEFPSENDPDVLYLENPRGVAVFRDEPEVTTSYRELFWELEDKASKPAELGLYLTRAIESLANDQSRSQ